MENNIYIKLMSLIEENHLVVIKTPAYDPQSGWRGNHYDVYDENEEEEEEFIVDISINGFCNNDHGIVNAIEKITTYFDKKDMNSAEKFFKWCDEIFGTGDK